MKNINEQVNRIHELMGKNQNLDESRVFPRLAQIMRGIVPSIDSFAIITAEHPMAQKLSDDENKKLNNKLESKLLSGRYGYKKIRGKYGNLENPFFINRISKADALRLGKEFNQESIVYGEKNKRGGMNFYLLKSNTGEIMGYKKVFVTLDNPDDFYSEVDGVHFVIPFFGIEEFIKDKEGEDVLVRGRRIQRNRNYSKVNWKGGKHLPTSDKLKFVKESLEKEYESLEKEYELLEEIQRNALSNLGSTAWNFF